MHSQRPNPAPRYLAYLLVTLVCGSCATVTVREVRGILLDVQSHEIVNAEAINLRDTAGLVRTYRVSPEVASNSEHPNTSAHLRQHMAAGDPVVVHYRETTEGPVAIRIFDTSSP